MVFSRTLLFLALITFARSDPVNRNNGALCQFFQNVETFQDDQWEDSVIQMKSLLSNMVDALQPYSEYQDYKERMKAYLDIGKTIEKSSSVQQKMEYFNGFNNFAERPFLTGSPAKKEALTSPLIIFRFNMINNVYSELHKKIIKAADDLERVLNFSDNSSRGELFTLINQYRKQGIGEMTETIASRILAFKEPNQCA
ncbi:uncharacterized protein LOC108092596 [Drosophila ficusphila]|uniref:uncharacterized protein LOC108092596 n=1 Tax=Drosophila ficusphila TaxID=30025 RepID=UPI0007E799FF|nr:uncharacterized protein LOC108092596 [Drosophila ficusphila]